MTYDMAYGTQYFNSNLYDSSHWPTVAAADKYSADFKDIAAKYIAGSFHRTEILRLDIEHLSGKHKELHK